MAQNPEPASSTGPRAWPAPSPTRASGRRRWSCSRSCC